MVRREVFGAGVDFPNAQFWTSTASRDADGGITFWIVDFRQGRTLRSAAGSYGVLCVR